MNIMAYHQGKYQSESDKSGDEHGSEDEEEYQSGSDKSGGKHGSEDEGEYQSGSDKSGDKHSSEDESNGNRAWSYTSSQLLPGEPSNDWSTKVKKCTCKLQLSRRDRYHLERW